MVRLPEVLRYLPGTDQACLHHLPPVHQQSFSKVVGLPLVLAAQRSVLVHPHMVTCMHHLVAHGMGSIQATPFGLQRFRNANGPADLIFRLLQGLGTPFTFPRVSVNRERLFG